MIHTLQSIDEIPASKHPKYQKKTIIIICKPGPSSTLIFLTLGLTAPQKAETPEIKGASTAQSLSVYHFAENARDELQSVDGIQTYKHTSTSKSIKPKNTHNQPNK